MTDRPMIEPKPQRGQTWEDRGTRVVVEMVRDDGSAIVLLPNGQRLPVLPTYFQRATLVLP